MSSLKEWSDYLRLLKNVVFTACAGFTRSELKKCYSLENQRAGNESKQVIYMADGKVIHGGLTDRLRGIVSVYKYCKTRNIEFKICFTSPFSLIEMLEPNEYDWFVDPADISYNLKDARSVFIGSRLRNDGRVERQVQEKICHYVCSKNYRQIHIYTNMHSGDSDFSVLFHELFKPSLRLQSGLDVHLSHLAGAYISVVFRFQQLLGDFVEGDYPVLPEPEKNKLLEKSLSCLADLHKRFSGRILVTSDSSTFLQQAAILDYVYVIEGEVAHFDYTKDASVAVYMKSFVDFFMLSGSQRIFLALSEGMYRSGFARRASMIHSIPYEIIEY